jgi:hypothetical protein
MNWDMFSFGLLVGAVLGIALCAGVLEALYWDCGRSLPEDANDD